MIKLSSRLARALLGYIQSPYNNTKRAFNTRNQVLLVTPKTEHDNILIPNIAGNISLDNNSVNKSKEIIVDTRLTRSTYKTFEPSIIYYMGGCRYSDYVSRMILPGNPNAYYIGKGIILKSDFTPLFIICTECVKSNDGTYTHSIYTIKLSREVFLNADINLNKFIINKMVPFYIKNENVKVCIEDLNGFIKVPLAPTSLDISEEANNYLIQSNFKF